MQPVYALVTTRLYVFILRVPAWMVWTEGPTWLEELMRSLRRDVFNEITWLSMMQVV